MQRIASHPNRFLAVLAIVSCLIVPGRLDGQTIGKTTTFNETWWWGSWTYDYTVTNAGGVGAQTLTKVCIDVPGGNARIDSISGPAGWTSAKVAGAGAVPDKICWTAPAGGGIPPGGVMPGFSATTVCGGTPYIEGKQNFVVSATIGGVFVGVGTGVTTDRLVGTGTLPRGLNGAGAGGNTANPYAAAGNQRLQHCYDSGEFPQQPIRILEIWIRPALSTAAGPGGTFSSLDVTLASSTNDFAGLSLAFTANVGTDATLVRSGPLTVPPIQAATGPTASWIPLKLTSSFVFDPCLGRDLLVDIRKCGSGNMGLAVDSAFDGSRARTVRNINSLTACTDPMASSTSLFAPVLRYRYELLQPAWQVDYPGARLRIGPLDSSGAEPLELTRALHAVESVSLGSRNLGMPWDVGITLGPGVPANQPPGVFTPGGQALNLNLADPSFTFLNGGAFNQPFVPLNLALTSAVAVGFSTQLAVVDPQLPDGVALSSMNRIRFVAPAAGSAAGPTSDDTSVAVNLAAIGAAPVLFAGTAFDVLYAGSNGRVTFIGADNDWTPSVAEARNRYPFLGAWTDLNPAAGGSISVTSLPNGVVQIAYANVPYFGQAALTSNLAIALDTASGGIALSGLSSFAVHPGGAAMFLGLSTGAEGEATDPGPTLFVPGGFHPGPSGHGMLYAYGTAGTLAPGVNTLQFIPAANGAYAWFGF